MLLTCLQSSLVISMHTSRSTSSVTSWQTYEYDDAVMLDDFDRGRFEHVLMLIVVVLDGRKLIV